MKRLNWRAAIEKLRDTPPFLILQKALRQVPFRPVDIGKLCFLQPYGVPNVPKSLQRGMGTVRAGSLEDLDALVLLGDQRSTFLKRFSLGDHCVVVLVDGRLVGYEWFCERDIHEESSWGYRIEIPGGFVYAYDAYIDPAYRNTGVWLRFKAYLAEMMVASGKRGVLTFVDYGNTPSLRTHLRFGFKPAATVMTFKVLGWLMTLNLDIFDIM